MSKSQLIIGSDELEFNEKVQSTMQMYDFRDLNIGNTFKSYTFDIPMTKGNEKKLGFPNLMNSEVNIPDEAKILVQGFELLRGQLQVLSIAENSIKALVNGDDWVNEIKGISIQDLSWVSGDNHTLNKTNVENSWTAGAGAFYRYPLINKGQLHSEDTGADADIYPMDLVPMWNVGDILERIFQEVGYEVDSGHFFNTTEGAKIYILSQPTIKPESYNEGKAVSARTNDRTDNFATISHSNGTNQSVEFTKSDGIRFDADSVDEAGAWANDAFVAPETGTYRFTAQVRVASEHVIFGQFSSRYQEWTLQFQKNGTLIGQQVFGSGSTEFGNYPTTQYGEFNIDSGWIHLDEGDELNLHGYFFSSAYNNGALMDVDLYILDDAQCYIQSEINDQNRHHGQYKSITPGEYLPDLDCVDFLKALKEVYNLVFWVDKMNRKVYCYTFDDFVGSNITDWTDRIDTKQKAKIDIIASKYRANQILKYKPDTDDRAYNSEVDINGIPFTKTVTLENSSVDPGYENVENSIFAPTVAGDMPQIGHTDGKVPRIFGDYELLSGKYYPEKNADKWLPRLLKWGGTVALTSGSFDLYENKQYATATNYTNFPEATTPDMSDIYNAYMTQRYRIIDKSKVLTARIYIRPGEISKLLTGGAANEGFRGLYKLNVFGQEALYYLTKVETNGLVAKCEFVQKV